MSNILKYKLCLIAFSLFILAFIPLSQNNFYKKATIKRWQQLDWDDFQGFVKPFTRFDAGISSNIYLEFDEGLQQYTAYAGQNNQLSYKKAQSISYNLLKHEQYHFNITEVHARLMNQYFELNPLQEEKDYLFHLRILKDNLSEMQKHYDRETDHSQNIDMQNRWEYKIDSMLHVLTAAPKFFKDSLAGAMAFFPEVPVIEVDDSTEPFKTYTLQKYQMRFTLFSAQTPGLDVDVFKEHLSNYYPIDSLNIHSFHEITNRYEYEVLIEYSDPETQDHTLQYFIFHNSNIYSLLAQYRDTGKETKGYKENARSFINSFRIGE